MASEQKPGKTRQAQLEDRKRAEGLMRVCEWLPKAEATEARAAGLLRYSRWIHPDDAPQMDALRDKLAKRRQKAKA